MLIFVTVMRDQQMYGRFFEENPHTQTHKLHTIDNRADNLHISVRYNQFLDTYDYTQDAWFVFCHEDWQLKEDLHQKLDTLDQGALYGPIGVAYMGLRHTPWYQLGLGIRRKRTLGAVIQSNRDGSEAHFVGRGIYVPKLVDTLDCQCLIVHSSLVDKHKLRFDTELSFDLYVEDFCLQARQAGIQTYATPLLAQHWSQGNRQARYDRQLSHLAGKYPGQIYAGIVSYIGGLA